MTPSSVARVPMADTMTPEDKQSRQPRPFLLRPLLPLVSALVLILFINFHSSLITLTLDYPRWAFFPGTNHRADPLRLDPSFNRTSPAQLRSYDWTITRSTAKYPDSVRRMLYLVNGVYPGPTIEANVGDRVRVRVRNSVRDANADGDEEAYSIYSSQVGRVLPRGSDNLLSLHWHGLSLRGSNGTMDGAVGFTSVPIKSGEEFVYEFLLGKEDAGTHWWHSHSGMSRADGLWGFLVVHDPSTDHVIADAVSPPIASDTSEGRRPWDDEILISLGDHFHKPAPVSLGWYLSRFSIGREPVPDNGLINGYNTFDCSRLVYPGLECTTSRGRRSEFYVKAGGTYRLRIVNTGAIGVQTFSIDGHALTVIEADGTLVRPFNLTHLTVIPGQRYSVLVHANVSREDAFWIRSRMDRSCFNMVNPALETETKAVLRYISSSSSSASGLLGWKWKANSGSTTDELRRDGRRTRAVGRHRSRRIVEPRTQPLPQDFELDPCRDLPLDLLRPLPMPQPHSSSNSGAAPSFDESTGDKRIILYAASPKLDRNGLVPMAVMNRTSWRWGRTLSEQEGGGGRDDGVEILKASNDSLLDRLRPFIWPGLDSEETEEERTKDIQEAWDQRHQLVVPIRPRVDINSSQAQGRSATVEVVLHNLDDDPHPIHLHGHKFAVLYRQGPTLSRYTWTAEHEGKYELESPIWRDTISVPERGFVVVRWKADNPGVWALHCHTLVHHMAGMAMAVVELDAGVPRSARS